MTILLVGATGNIGRHFVQAARDLSIGIEVMLRPQSAADPEKQELVAPFPIREGTLDDYASLVKAFQGVDTVICTTSDHDLAPQLSLVKAAKEAGVKRIIPSEFSCDLIHPNSPEVLGYEGKTAVRKAIQDAGLEWTCIQSNAFMSWFGPGCFNMLAKPYPTSVEVYGSGEVPLTLTKEVDIGKVALRAAQDRAVANKHIVIAFPGNTLTQNAMIDLWERESGEKVERVPLSAQEIRDRMKEAYAAGKERFLEAITMHVIQGYVLNSLATGELHDGQLLAHKLYPDLTYTKLEDYYTELVADGKPAAQ